VGDCRDAPKPGDMIRHAREALLLFKEVRGAVKAPLTLMSSFSLGSSLIPRFRLDTDVVEKPLGEFPVVVSVRSPESNLPSMLPLAVGGEHIMTEAACDGALGSPDAPLAAVCWDNHASPSSVSSRLGILLRLDITTGEGDRMKLFMLCEG